MDPIEILGLHDLKRTSSRQGIIEIIMTANQALSEAEIRERLSRTYDRTTFYRSFKTLEEAGILHKIVIDSQLVKYAICDVISLNKKHAHFYCNECHSVQCLESVSLRSIKLPEGFTGTETEVLIRGICSECKDHFTE